MILDQTMDKPVLKLAMTLTIALSCFADRTAQASLITESSDFGNTRATAQNLDGLFTASSNLANDNVYGIGDPTVIIKGGLGVAKDVDFFRFSGIGGDSYIFDVDGGQFDSVLGLFNSRGVLIANADDMNASFDPGSTLGRDAFMGTFTLPQNDTYFFSISEFGNRPAAYSSFDGVQMYRPNTGEVGSGVGTDSNRDRNDNGIANDSFTNGSPVSG